MVMRGASGQLMTKVNANCILSAVTIPEVQRIFGINNKKKINKKTE